MDEKPSIMLGGTVVFVKRPDSWALDGGHDWKLNNAAGNVVVLLVARLPGLLWIDPVLEFRVWDRGIGKLDVGRWSFDNSPRRTDRQEQSTINTEISFFSRPSYNSFRNILYQIDVPSTS